MVIRKPVRAKHIRDLPAGQWEPIIPNKVHFLTLTPVRDVWRENENPAQH